MPERWPRCRASATSRALAARSSGVRSRTVVAATRSAFERAVSEANESLRAAARAARPSAIIAT